MEARGHLLVGVRSQERTSVEGRKIANAPRVGGLVDNSIIEAVAVARSGQRLHLPVVLRGAFVFVFAADLMRRLDDLGVETIVDFCRVASYGDSTEPGGARG